MYLKKKPAIFAIGLLPLVLMLFSCKVKSIYINKALSRNDKTITVSKLSSKFRNFYFTDLSKCKKIPFEIVDNFVVLEVKVNSTKKINAIFDTGNSDLAMIVLNSNLINQFGAEYISEFEAGGLGNKKKTKMLLSDKSNSLELFGINLYNQEILAVKEDIGFNNNYYDALIGGTLDRFIINIDYEKNVIGLHTKIDSLVDSTWTPIPFTLETTNYIPLISAEVINTDGKKRKVKLIVDTGSSCSLMLFSYGKKKYKCDRDFLEINEGFGAAGNFNAKVIKIDKLLVDKYTFDKVNTAIVNIEGMGGIQNISHDGILGNDVLKRFNIIFDYREKTMFLKPNNLYSDPFNWNLTGFAWTTMKDKKKKIIEVYKNSPSEDVDIKKGDIILEINNTKIEEYSIDDISKLLSKPNQRIAFKIERGNDLITRTITLKEYF